MIERAGDTALIATPLPAPSNEALATLGKKLDAAFVLGARLARSTTPAAPATIEPAPQASATDDVTSEVVLLRGKDGAIAWSSTFPVSGSDPATLGAHIADAVRQTTPAK